MDVHRNRNPNFICLKWSLFTITVLMFVGCICLAALSGKIVDSYYITDNEQKDLAKSLLIAMAVVSALFSFSGLYGSYKEHYCSTVTFCVYMTINTIGNLYAAIHTSSLWSNAVIDLCITCLAFSFARQLRIQRILSVSNNAVLRFGPQQGQTVIIPVVPNYCSDPYNPSAQQQWSPPQQPPPYAQQDFPSKLP